MADTHSPTPPAILFDLDGTLIDTIERILSSARHTVEGWHRGTPTDEEWVHGIGTPLVQQLRAYTADEDEVAHLLARYRKYQAEHHDRLTRAYDGVPEVVSALAQRGHPLAIVTSKATPIARQSLTFVGLDGYFPTIIGFDETTRHKPDPEPVNLALQRLGITSDRAVFVGDSPYDIQAGKAAGVLTVAALWGAFSRETLADANPNHFIGSVADLPGVLDQAFVRGL
jgi:pyrophosphatase PpaX